jgi:uncharacterized PurR-regulated membrane protein YhhQ (DUF165 family)
VTPVLVLLYLAAIVAANLSSTHFGPEASVVNAFLFIGLNLTTRDRLHDLWKTNRVVKMAALIATGSILSYLVNQDAARIALASCAAFAAAETVDFIVYSWRRRQGVPWLERSNESNIASASVDSVIFPLIAFPGPLVWLIVFGQFTAKVAGGFVWSLALRGRRERVVPVEA